MTFSAFNVLIRHNDQKITAQKKKFSIKISSLNLTKYVGFRKSGITADLVTFTEEIFNGKLLCSGLNPQSCLHFRYFQGSKFCLVNWRNTVNTKRILNNFSGSILVKIFVKCWDLENLKKFPRKYIKRNI